jgi:hypothetical protein
MNRKQLYNEIASLNLQDEVRATYGKNYTNCSNEQLKAVVDKAVAGFEVTGVNPASFDKLVEILTKKKILLKSEVTVIMNA